MFRHCGKKLWFNLGESWCGRSVSPTVCDCADPSHQFLRPHHTTITTNHNMKKKIPPRCNTPVTPTKHQPKTTCPHLPTRKEGLEGQREVQELDIRMCWNHIKSEPRTQTITLHSRPIPLFVTEYVKLTPHCQLAETCSFNKMVSRTTRRHFHVQEDIWTSVRTHESQPNNLTKTPFVSSLNEDTSETCRING
jgi:hypothetical protein